MHWLVMFVALSLLWSVLLAAFGPGWWMLSGPPLGLLGFVVCQVIEDRSRA